MCGCVAVKGSKGKSNLKKFILALNQLFAVGIVSGAERSCNTNY